MARYLLCVLVGKGLQEEGSSDGSAVVGGVQREAGGRGDDILIAGLQ